MNSKPRFSASLAAVCAVLLGLAILAAPAAADPCVFPVSVGSESALSAALTCYNAETTAGERVITLTADIPLNASLPGISNARPGVSLLIKGAGFAVNGQGKADLRVLAIGANTAVTLENLTVTGGGAMQGAGIGNSGTLTLRGCRVTGNGRVVLGYPQSFGGGIYNTGALTVLDSTISGNQSTQAAAIYNDGAVLVDRSTISDNRAAWEGGVIFNNGGSLVTVNSTIAANVGGAFGNWGARSQSSTAPSPAITPPLAPPFIIII